MTERELSERLCSLGCRLEEMAESDNEDLLEIAKELHNLSNEKYSPGTSTWTDLKKMVAPKKKYTDRRGVLPF